MTSSGKDYQPGECHEETENCHRNHIGLGVAGGCQGKVDYWPEVEG